MPKDKNIAVFASGRGSNTQNIIEYFKNKNVKVSLIVTDNKNAGVLRYASDYDIPAVVLSKDALANPSYLMDLLDKYRIDLIVLAGFLKLIPPQMIKAYKNKIVNIHPALLPDYGGKGMYGMNVHKAVKKAGEEYSGITIHFVNENYDEGEIIFQKKIKISPDDTPEDIADKIHKLEYKYYPLIIESLLSQ